jgi:hypothetical protein
MLCQSRTLWIDFLTMAVSAIATAIAGIDRGHGYLFAGRTRPGCPVQCVSRWNHAGGTRLNFQLISRTKQQTN